jgi:eukaryotic-like serine/threonine-protein kinase
MMQTFDNGRWLRASSHLDRVLDLPPHQRAACLDEIRATDPEIATDVEAMLDQHRQLSAEGFLDTVVPIKPVEASLAGVTIGTYTLTSVIGYGGMGSVWLASRSDGRFEGQVAVKLLNAALVGRGGEERFRREGTILARLSHPHIARLIDAGVSSTGQPYLVLELVKGQHIDTYCDEERLSVEARIRLFLDVLSAVAHAHANLIVHRDVKPSNVLVTADGQVKLLDFSIAKLIEDDGLSRLTREGGAAMTPKYAAPEQVTGGPITTATDVYSLGVLLFESLSGQHPAGRSPKSPAEFAAAITEREPLRLSAAVHQGIGSEELERVAAQRATTPDRLARLLRGDLETILGKALKKDHTERYGSVAEFADDLRRHVEHQPITARADTVRYRTAKFARRHWRGLGAGAAAAIALVTLVGFYTVRLATERDRATLNAEKAARVSGLLTEVLTSADPYRTSGAAPTVRDLLDDTAARIETDLFNQPESQVEMFAVIGRTYERLGLLDKALPSLERALAVGRRTFGTEDVRVAQSLNNLGVLQRVSGNLAAAEPLLVESLAIRRRLLGSDDKDVAITLVELARLLKDRGRSDEAEAPIREALAIRKRLFGDEHRETATSKNELGLWLWEHGDLAGAETLLRENVATSERLLGPDHPNAGTSKGNLGNLLNAKGDAEGAEALLRENIRVRRKVFGDAHTEYAMALPSLAGALETQGKLAEAQALLEQALQIARPQLGKDHPRVVGVAVDLARVSIERGHGAASEATLRHALQIRERLYPADDWRIAQAQSLLGAALLAQGRPEEAEPLMRAADRVLKPIPGRQAREQIANRTRLATLARTGK